jgi:TatD DNase family protein
LGEVGLDFKDARDAVQQERQREALRAQLEWAAAMRKPVNVHCRRAEREIAGVAAEFARRTGLGVDLHWFTHSEKMARVCAEAGVFISPGPSILHDEKQARVAARIAADWLLLETDSPVEYGGEPARPAWAARVARRLAELRGEPFEVLAARLQSNLRRYRVTGRDA